MVRARAASRIGASIPFGAAHRVYFDTPPLKGYCRGTLVPCCEPDESREFTKMHVPCK
jgi:hypothetical protein